jgi:hypothetical protein
MFYSCHSERSEESSWILGRLNSCEPPAGFFAALRMTNQGFELVANLANAQSRGVRAPRLQQNSLRRSAHPRCVVGSQGLPNFSDK